MNRRREEENTSYRKPGPSAERIAATVQLQTPDGYRDPASLVHGALEPPLRPLPRQNHPNTGTQP